VRRIRSHSASQGRACVDFALEKLGKKWTFVLTDYAYGHSFYDELVPLLEARGGQVLDKIAVPVQTQDMIPYLAGINPETEVLFSVFTTADGLRYLRQIHELGLSSKMARIGPWGMVDGVSLAGIEDALEGCYFLSHSPRWLDQVPEANRAHVAAARDIIGVGEDGLVKGTDRIIATSYYLAPWHALHLLKHTVEASGWKSKSDNPALLDAIAKFEGKASPDFPMSDFVMGEEGRQAYQDLWIEQVQGGKLVVQAAIGREKLI
jgi:branched-chain amino acid transport system substrate-binding protein